MFKKSKEIKVKEENDIVSNPIFGVKPHQIDLRDYKIKSGEVYETSFEFDDLPPIKNQKSINSCAAHSSSSILEWFNKKEINEHRDLSVGFIYGMQGVEFNRRGEGMYLRDVCKILQKYGDCLAETIPYNIEMPECYERLKDDLNEDIYKESAICRVKSYAKCTTDNAIKHALMQNSPILMSVKWYTKSSVDKNGVINFDTKSNYGYHAIMVYGFNENGWLCQNSWGKYWGNKGRFILPYKYGFKEAWCFVDADNNDVYKPKRNKFLDFFYKIFNYIINLFRKK